MIAMKVISFDNCVAGMLRQAVANCRFQKAENHTENYKENGSLILYGISV
jgi:hypothetical protein